MKLIKGYIGTYDSPGRGGIYEFSLDTDTGRINGPKLFYKAKNAKCAALWDGRLAAPAERDGKAGIMLLDTGRTGKPLLDEIFEEERTACYITYDGRFLYTANYHEGGVLVYSVSGDRLKVEARIATEPGAGCHQVQFHGPLMLVPCLELDEIRLYNREEGFRQAGVISFPKGSGPRHGIFNREHSRLYVVGERSLRLYVYETGRGTGSGEAGPFGEFRLTGTESLTPQGAAGQAAAVRLSPDGRFLYVSVRGADLLAVYRITDHGVVPVQYTDCGGRHPRDFILSPDGRFLLVVNRFTNELVCLERDVEAGLIGRAVSAGDVPEGVGIVL